MITPIFPLSVYAKRRNLISQTFKPQSDILLLFNPAPRIKSNDTHFKYRADSSFAYLTGFTEAYSALAIWKDNKGKTQSTLFCQARDPIKELWNGEIIGPTRARQNFGTDEALPIEKLKEFCTNFFANRPSGVSPRIFTNALQDPLLRKQLDAITETIKTDPRGLNRALHSLNNSEPLTFEARLIKDKFEIEAMRKASKINVAAHLELLKKIQPGLKEYQVQAIIEYEFMYRGADGPAYGSICAAGKNATCLHYEPAKTSLKDGELILVDAGCDLNYYSSDITRTYPVNGKYTQAQKNIMAIVAEAHQEAINKARVGIAYSAFHEAATEAIIEGLRHIKFLKGTKKEILEKASYKAYFPHGTGHWLGLDVHDPCPRFDDKNKSIKLKPGMIFTVEPGVYIPANDKSVPEEYRGIGIRIEDDILVKAGKPEILTDGLPRYADEIEKFMSRHKPSV